MCGGRGAVLRGPGTDEGIVLSLQQVRYWRLVGFSVREGQKGVMADGTSDTVVQDLAVTQIGDEAVHLRANSTDNVVSGLTISDTGLRQVKFGEGIYVGSAVEQLVRHHRLRARPQRPQRRRRQHDQPTAAESVDIKEGTTGGVLADNTFDGAGMRGEADSWVDVKGNGWLVQANHGRPPAVGLRGQPPGRRLGYREHLRRQHRRRRRPRLRLRTAPADRRPRRAQPRHLYQHRHRRRRGPHQHDLRLTDHRPASQPHPRSTHLQGNR